MEIKQLTEPGEFRKCVEIQRAVWPHFNDTDYVPESLMSPYSEAEDAWGIILGAFEAWRMVGFVICLPTSHSETYWLHMMGVLDKYRSGNAYGQELMDRLKQELMKRDVRKLVWTYDPLESLNAHFYIHKYRAICRKYVEDCYGFSSNADRLKAELFLDEEEREQSLGRLSDSQVEIPFNYAGLHPDEQHSWRMKTRDHFTSLINTSGLIVTDYEYTKNDPLGKYVFSHAR